MCPTSRLTRKSTAQFSEDAASGSHLCNVSQAHVPPLHCHSYRQYLFPSTWVVAFLFHFVGGRKQWSFSFQALRLASATWSRLGYSLYGIPTSFVLACLQLERLKMEQNTANDKLWPWSSAAICPKYSSLGEGPQLSSILPHLLLLK